MSTGVLAKLIVQLATVSGYSLIILTGTLGTSRPSAVSTSSPSDVLSLVMMHLNRLDPSTYIKKTHQIHYIN